MNQPPSLGSFFLAIPWLVAIAGWLVANHQANRRETRKELRSDITEICSAISAVRQSLRAQQEEELGSNKRKLAQIAIKQELFAIDLRCSRLFDRKWRTRSKLHLQRVKLNLEAFFDLSSGDILESNAEMPVHQSEALLFQQHSAGLMLDNSLQQLFLVEFKVSN